MAQRSVKRKVEIFNSFKCFKPFPRKSHDVSLHKLPPKFRSIFPNISENAKICFGCRMQLYKGNFDPCDRFDRQKKKGSSDINNNDERKNMSIKCPSVSSDDESCSSTECNNRYHKAGVEVIEQLKDKFRNSQNFNEKVTILTLAPKSWGRIQLKREFGATDSQAKQAIKLASEKGILSSPDKIRGKTLSSDVESAVLNFYERDDISRLMPGIQDYVSVKQMNGVRNHVQKRLILCNLNELYTQFKEENMNMKIGFSKFAQLRPKHCVLAGSSRTHTVCTCLHHENIKLMILGANIKKITNSERLSLSNYKDCINATMCKEPKVECHERRCNTCPDMTKMKEYLINIFDKNCVSEVKFDLWQQTNRCTLETLVYDVDSFVTDFCERLEKLKVHDFISRQQTNFFNKLKEELSEGEFIITFDFAENYAFIKQNSVQSFHWNNNQATVFTIVMYYREDEKVNHKSMVVISDDLRHNTVAVYAYQNIIIQYIKDTFKDIRKIYYFTDGASQHFKNRNNFCNLAAHKNEFDIEAEWHFHATAHGKGACDGVGGNLKRLAARYSLQGPLSQHILNAKDLFNWAAKNMKETQIFYSSKEEHDAREAFLKPRFENSVQIKGTLHYHAYIPTSDNKLIVKTYSSSDDFKVFHVP